MRKECRERAGKGLDQEGIAFWFFIVAALCVTIGMSWGIQMSVSGNHTLGAAHAHQTLVGWVTMALFGFYHRAVPKAADRPLAFILFFPVVSGVVFPIPGSVPRFTNRVRFLPPQAQFSPWVRC